MKTVLSVASARPNFVKLAAVHHAIQEHAANDINHVIVHTGQHYDPLFSDIFFEQLAIPMPAHNLGIAGGDRESVITQTAVAIRPILQQVKPDALLVYGDVNGAVGAARSANELEFTLGHVEAGLRSFDPAMPEEHNRIAMDKISQLLFCTEESGVRNLVHEGIDKGIHMVGNTMIDTLIRMLPIIQNFPLEGGLPKQFAVVTMHRPSNVDTKEALERNLSFLGEVAQFLPVVFPMHHRVRAAVDKFGATIPENIFAIPALGYLPFLRMMMSSSFILTDSGGIQEEAVLLQKRCFTLRKNTERPVTIASGSNLLIDLEKQEDVQEVISYAANPYPIEIEVPPLWDGHAGERIVDILLKTI